MSEATTLEALVEQGAMLGDGETPLPKEGRIWYVQHINKWVGPGGPVIPVEVNHDAIRWFTDGGWWGGVDWHFHYEKCEHSTWRGMDLYLTEEAAWEAFIKGCQRAESRASRDVERYRHSVRWGKQKRQALGAAAKEIVK